MYTIPVILKIKQNFLSNNKPGNIKYRKGNYNWIWMGIFWLREGEKGRKDIFPRVEKEKGGR